MNNTRKKISNENGFEEIKKLIRKQNFELAKNVIHSTRDKKNFFSIQIELAKILSYEGNYEGAEEILINLYNRRINNKGQILSELMFLYIKTEQFEKASLYLDDYLSENDFPNMARKTDYVKCCINKGNGIDLSEEEISKSYYYRQLNNYNTESAIKYIYNNYCFHEEFSQKRFNDDVNIYTLFDNIKSILDPKYLYPETGCFDKYLFKVPNVGENFVGNTCNYISVLVQKNTKNIINIIPISSIDKNEHYCFDLNAILLEEDFYCSLLHAKTKTLSRIDKFNQKYNMN